jgi:hypothetical protein
MKPIHFDGCNVTYAKNQPEYFPLPAHRTDDGKLIICWYFGLAERIKLLFTGKLWQRMLTFNKPLQPQYLSVKKKEM